MSDRMPDRRIRKTKKLLRQGLVQLMAQKKLNEITVRELSDLVDVNRGTFYLHYRDIYDLVAEIEQELFDEFYLAINRHPVTDLKLKPLPTLLEVFRFIAGQADVCKAFLSDNGDIAFVEKLKGVIRGKLYSSWTTLIKSGNADLFEYFNQFIISGSFGILKHWLETGMKEPPEQMAALVERIILVGIRGLLADSPA